MGVKTSLFVLDSVGFRDVSLRRGEGARAAWTARQIEAIAGSDRAADLRAADFGAKCGPGSNVTPGMR
jgi:hypothetical protein